ncbi:hypothetical protein MVEG_05966 [Podila verticillata NRRL 6337]|nr:hypothetical protein MVEG_05966 [Podila verticillata NRRL 6337]
MTTSPQQQKQAGQPRQQPGGISQAFAVAGSPRAASPSPSSPSISLVAPVTYPSEVASSPTMDDTSVLTSSSPVFSGAHPFLRKFQTTVNKVLQQQKFQKQAQQQQASEPSPQRASPTTEAAAVMDSILAKRVGHLNVNERDSKAKCKDGSHYTSYPTTTAASASTPIAVPAGSNCNCASSGPQPVAGSVGEMDLFFDDDEEEDMRIEPSHFPPVSEEAREFSDRLLSQNKAWAIKTEQERPGFFARLEEQQKPQVLWIGCSDSRVPANQIVNLDPGEIFVHRNIANVVTHTDMNLLSVLEYAVDVLKVRHIIICGHYGCGGVAASLTQKQYGIIDNWLRNIKDLYTIHRKKFDTLEQGSKEQKDLLTELNVIQSALNVCHTSIVQKAWSRGEKLSVHGWCYRLSDGVIRNLGLCVEGPGNVEEVYHVMDEVKSAH